MHFKLLIILLFFGFALKAQTQEDVIIKDLVESIAENLPEDFDLSELIERLTLYKRHPIDLNKTTTEELNSLFFLSPLQISNLFTHIKANGKLTDILELQAIDGFDLKTITTLQLFATINAPNPFQKITLNNLIKLGYNDLVVRYGQVIEQQRGFTDLPGSRYLGTADKILTRYKYDFENIISASLVLEKDAGERFSGTMPFDYISGNVALFKLGRLKKVVLGDYSIQFGQGLTLWSGFGFGKGPDITSVVKKDVGLRPYTSANEFSFFRGIAATINIAKNIDFTPFVSFRKLDASLSLGNNGTSQLTTLGITGLHRTPTEISNKNSLSQQIYGATLQYNKNSLTVGAIAYQTKFNKTFITGTQLYNKYSFTGNNLTNLGLHYNYTFKNIYFFGEIAKSLNSGLAYVNGALISLSPIVSAGVLHRNYAKNYYSFFNQGTAEASEAFNENGLYAGLNVVPNKHWAITIYGDYFKFPWLKFRVDAPSAGYEILSQLTYTPTKTFKAIARYKTELKQQNTDLAVPINFLDNVLRETYRLEVSWRLNSKFALQNRVEVSQFKKGETKAEFGYLIYQDIDYSPLSSKLSANIRLAYFNTASFNSRIYAYEDDVLYNFSFGLYNGKGARSYLNVKYNIKKHLDVWARYAAFIYSNTRTVGSGLDEINGNKKSDFRLQMRYQF